MGIMQPSELENQSGTPMENIEASQSIESAFVTIDSLGTTKTDVMLLGLADANVTTPDPKCSATCQGEFKRPVWKAGFCWWCHPSVKDECDFKGSVRGPQKVVEVEDLE